MNHGKQHCGCTKSQGDVFWEQTAKHQSPVQHFFRHRDKDHSAEEPQHRIFAQDRNNLAVIEIHKFRKQRLRHDAHQRAAQPVCQKAQRSGKEHLTGEAEAPQQGFFEELAEDCTGKNGSTKISGSLTSASELLIRWF